MKKLKFMPLIILIIILTNFALAEDKKYFCTEYGTSQNIKLEAIQCEIIISDMSDIYKNKLLTNCLGAGTVNTYSYQHSNSNKMNANGQVEIIGDSVEVDNSFTFTDSKLNLYTKLSFNRLFKEYKAYVSGPFGETKFYGKCI